jgi:hypothetical protein
MVEDLDQQLVEVSGGVAMSKRGLVPGTPTETHIEQEQRVCTTPGGTARFLVLIVLSLTAFSLVGQLAVHFAPDFFGRDWFAATFDVNDEANVPTLYSTLAILGCAVLLHVIAGVEREAGGRWSRHWRLMSVIFVGLAADEFLRFHEVINHRLHLPVFTWSWIAVGIVFVIVVGLIFFRMIDQLPSLTRGLFILAALIYLGGAIVTEMVASQHIAEWGYDSLRYAFCVTAEEFLEMMGIVIFIYALLSYLTREGRKVVLCWELRAQ